MEPRKPLDLSQPFCTRRQPLTILSKTIDGKGLVFERSDSKGVFMTDLNGYAPGKDDLQTVFNGYPEQFAASRYRSQYAIGDVVFYLRTAAKERKVLVGRVERVDAKGLVLAVFDAYGLKISAKKRQADGTILVPFNFAFKSPEDMLKFANSFQNDVEKAMTTYRNVMGVPEVVKTTAKIPFTVKKRGRPAKEPSRYSI
jgi:hypothetical protein